MTKRPSMVDQLCEQLTLKTGKRFQVIVYFVDIRKPHFSENRFRYMSVSRKELCRLMVSIDDDDDQIYMFFGDGLKRHSMTLYLASMLDMIEFGILK